VQRSFSRLGFSFLAGLCDLNSEFDVLQSAGVFLNSSEAIDPTFAFSGPNGPSIFPNTTLGLRIKWQPTPSIYLQTVVLNGLAGDPDDPSGTHVILGRGNGVLWTTEAGYLFRPAPTAVPGSPHRARLERFAVLNYEAKVAAGAWY
jgi:porin